MGFEFWGRNCETRSTEPPLEVPFSNFGVGNTEPSAQSGPKPFRSPGFGPQTAKPGPGAPFEASKYENGVKICPNSNVAKKHRFHYKIINKNNNFCVGKGGTLSWAALGLFFEFRGRRSTEPGAFGRRFRILTPKTWRPDPLDGASRGLLGAVFAF